MRKILSSNIEKILKSKGIYVSKTKSEHFSCSFIKNTRRNKIVYIDGQEPKSEGFYYFGSIIYHDREIEKDIQRIKREWLKKRNASKVLYDHKFSTTEGNVL